MIDANDRSTDDRGHLAQPPLVDSLHYEKDADGFSIAFVPSNGDDPTHSVFVPRDSSEGRLVSAHLYRIQALIGHRLEKLTHGGGADYTLQLAGGESLQLSKKSASAKWVPEVFDRLKQIAETAEAAFALLHAGHQ